MTVMTVEEQRNLGVKLAAQLDAGKTLDIIKDTGSCYDEIFRSAAAELGTDKLASLVLEQNEPSWALAVLRHVPEIDDYRQALIAKSAPLLESVKLADAPAPDATLGKVAAFELYVEVGASYSAYSTMYWQTDPNVIEPAAGYAPNNPPVKWSDIVRVAQSATNICEYFALPKAPLHVGNTVWMMVDVSGGGFYNTNYKFTYDPSVDSTVVISASGGTVTAQFTWSIKK